MQHLRIFVVNLADAMPAVFAHDRIALRLDMALDRVTDVAERRAGADLADAEQHRFERGVDETLGEHRGRSCEIHAAGVAVPAVLDNGHVDVDDVAVLEDLARVRNAVADHMIDRRAQRLLETLVTDIGRDRFLHIDDVLVGEAVEFLGADAGFDVRNQYFQHLGGEAASDAHLLDLVRCFDSDWHGISM